MTDEQAYELWLREGGNGVDLAVTRQALAFAAAEPTAALRLKSALEQAEREADAVMLYESTAMAHGSSAEDARRDAIEHVRAEREERITEAVSEAHAAAFRRTRQTF
jgi:hypothetical protein